MNEGIGKWEVGKAYEQGITPHPLPPQPIDPKPEPATPVALAAPFAAPAPDQPRQDKTGPERITKPD